MMIGGLLMTNKGWYVTQRSHACFGCEQLSMQRAKVEKEWLRSV